MSPNLLERARRAVAAAQHSDDVELSAFYCAHARLALARCKDELREVALVLKEREAELVRRGAPKTQIALGEGKP